MEVLEKIFGSMSKVKIMRLFLFSPQLAFDTKEVAKRSRVPLSKTRTEINNLYKVGLIKKKQVLVEIKSKAKNKKIKKKKVWGWALDDKFPFLLPLQNFLIHIPSSQYKEIIDKLKKVGSIKLLIVSGVFIQNWDSRLDILVVGDNLKKNAINLIMSDVESEIGKELRYAFFDTKEFIYRLGVYDKLIRDVLDYPHKKIINKFDNLK